MDGAPQSPVVASKPRRRWLQLSMRAMLGLVALFGVLMGVVIRPAEQQRRAVAQIEKAGGAVGFSTSYSADQARWENSLLRGCLPRGYFDQVLRVEMVNRRVADEAFRALSEFKELRVLDLSGAQFDEAGLAHLSGLTKLEHLSLDGTPVTDAGLAHLAGLSNVMYLSLAETQITGEGFRHFSRLDGLGWLRLGGTRTTDDGLVHLAGLPKLRYVELAGAPTTDAGVERLRRALPNGGMITRRSAYWSLAPPILTPASQAP